MIFWHVTLHHRTSASCLSSGPTEPAVCHIQNTRRLCAPWQCSLLYCQFIPVKQLIFNPDFSDHTARAYIAALQLTQCPNSECSHTVYKGKEVPILQSWTLQCQSLCTVLFQCLHAPNHECILGYSTFKTPPSWIVSKLKPQSNEGLNICAVNTVKHSI